MRVPALFVLLTAAFPVKGQAPTSASVSGIVINAVTGVPLHRASVGIHPADDAQLWASAPTDSSGRFTILDLPPGKYRLHVDRNGFYHMDYGSAGPDQWGTILELASGQHLDQLVIKLPPLGVIAGTVTDPEGQLLPDATLQALHRTYLHGKPAFRAVAWAETDDRGQFRIGNLRAGRYMVVARKAEAVFRPSSNSDPASRPEEVNYADTYYPGASAADYASLLTVGPGQVVRDIQIQLQYLRPARLHGHVKAPFEVPDKFNFPLQLSDGVNGQPRSMTWGFGASNDGAFDFSGIRPGRYELSCLVTVQDRVYSARQIVDISGNDVEITVPLEPAGDLLGALVLEGNITTPVQAHRVFLVSGEGSGDQPLRATVQPDGKFTIRNVPPGIWDIGVEPIPQGGYIKAMNLGTRDVLRLDMTITPGTSQQLEIVVSGNGAAVSGKVEGSPTASVLLAPEGKDKDVLSFYRVAVLDDTGHFKITGITPGAYKLYAFDKLAPDAWQDPEFLGPFESAGTAIELREGSKIEQDLRIIGSGGTAN